METEKISLNGLGVCWIGNPRYAKPLNPTDEKKWHLLSGLHIEMFVIGFSESPRPHRFDQMAHFYLLPLLPVSILRYAEMFLVAPLLALWIIFRHQVQVIIAQSPFEGAIGAFAKNVARLFSKRVILIVENHGDFEVSVFAQRQVVFVQFYRWLMGLSSRYAFHYADQLRAISRMTARQLEKRVPGKPIHQFMTWTDSQIFRETSREKPLSQTNDLLYVGVLIPRKGVDFLIDAFGRIATDYPQAHLWLVGKAENQEYAMRLEQQTLALDLSERVHFTGAVSQQVLAQYMGRARVLVLPSTSEGLGRVLIEAMLCGTPAVGSDVDGIPDVIQHGINGYLIPAGDVETLAKRLADILSDPNIEAMGERARAFAKLFFSETAYLEGYRKLLQDTVNILEHKK